MWNTTGKTLCLSALQIKVAALNEARKTTTTQQWWVSLRRSQGQSGLMAVITLLSESSKWFDCSRKSLTNVQQWDVRDIKIWHTISPPDSERVNIRFHNLFRRMWLQTYFQCLYCRSPVHLTDLRYGCQQNAAGFVGVLLHRLQHVVHADLRHTKTNSRAKTCSHMYP